ncbi:GIY-YIG nuclease family protein [Paucihalobacter sp.]|uniref:GIY-YIG nuclease family protein n=1 Tax=Paucihalobacter sp. TaxID=2850405 RepID=UPI003D1605FE
MKYFIYILYARSVDKFYVGESPDVAQRLSLHENHHFKRAFTKIADDWEIKLEFQCQNREDALFLEKFIKRMKSKKFIQKIIQNPDILTQILTKK